MIDSVELLFLIPVLFIAKYFTSSRIWTSKIRILKVRGRIPWLEQGNAMPHTDVLPLNYIHLYIRTIYFHKPGEKFEFSLLMHEINVLTN